MIQWQRLAIVLVLSGIVAAPAAAQQEPVDVLTELGLSVDIGFDGRGQEGTWQPVSVTVEPSRPVEGTLTVSSASTFASESMAVEIAAGSRKVFRFLQPPGPLRVTFDEPDAEPVSLRSSQSLVTTEYVVGLLGQQPGSLAPLRSEITGQSGAWVGLDPAWVEKSAFALQSLSAVVADTAALQGLTPAGRSNLAAAVADGKDLVIAGAADPDLQSLGLPWRMTEDAWTLRAAEVQAGDNGIVATAIPAGLGRVIVTEARPGEGTAGRSGALWSTIAQPSSATHMDSTEFRVTSAPHQFSRLFAERDGAGPALPGLGAFVIVYVLVVGPVNAIVLGRLGRRELAWATVPLVTIVFTAGAFFGATNSRPASGGAARLTYWTDGPATEFLATSVRAATPGTREVTLPGDAWTVRLLVDGGRRAGVSRGTDTRASMNLTALQMGGVAAWRTSTAAAPLDITATAGRDEVDVTVRNVSGRALRQVVVRAATATRSVGTLEAGAETSVSFSGSLPRENAYRDPFEGLQLDNNGSVRPPLSLRGVFNSEVADGRPGLVWVSAVDTTTEPLEVTATGGEVRDLGSLVAVGARVRTQGQGLSPFGITRSAIAAVNGAYQPGPQAIEGSGQVFLRFRLPPGADPDQMTNQLDDSRQSGGRADITVWDWQQGQWTDDASAFAGDPQRLVGPMGEVWARANGELFPFEYSGRTIAGGI